MGESWAVCGAGRLTFHPGNAPADRGGDGAFSQVDGRRLCGVL